ncbi:hypothetical protein QP893_06210 [Corynebacterium pseudodiphtheriticum]|uniref:hypothetical protein n=1 Tax=Corynebacterium pseudodiphtheriticum TaxID=37637 RepID=UPI00254FCD74|nr:hypothetical protein [Corynebacterium pseudodiphtheriticum]MDK8487597.1 hypothetical protein [Corynebacterium pseudodiphtheriticum]MDK8494831.1 hypothetical protein [Corynebacterium pseudodiphtheriticum]MDK8614358.1 hypothetical protein [Corynebacterium pseudodiphtheriticum]MDK8738296.1 hypothetical protein [Corynebacterium pseudodiphtheriticum]
MSRNKTRIDVQAAYGSSSRHVQVRKISGGDQTVFVDCPPHFVLDAESGAALINEIADLLEM